ncbi:MAG: hypothetical protein ABIS36_16070 [Chryseolinea sp.]
MLTSYVLLTALKEGEEVVRFITLLSARQMPRVKRMLNPTRVLDRQYFRSIYFTEPGGVLFEVATADDLFTKDEVKEHLGELLKLPEWLEKNREKNEKSVTPVVLKT